ncbi:hypothetical protein LZ009_09375 [Ramlibacter sp. XY19]|uniref:hypothetical protein n=1 Tax=Ramlibacter paludis TaxID=2908000 RepID=UPI0023DB863D|nr:hypothetical protein [Ramlibacter paludis]MCG2592990.1 hypothetical protein [Ramlibacter paludis]
MPSPEALLEKARKAPARQDLAEHLETIKTLRDKKWSWREVAEFLKENGVDTDHTKLLRFMQKQENRWSVPGSADYYEALKSLVAAGQLKSPSLAMLQFLYEAHNRTATYTELAHAAARAGVKVSEDRPHSYANREFGTLGKQLGLAVGMEFLPSSRRDAPFYSSSIGVGSSVTPEGGEFELVMHHELAKALDRLVEEKVLFNAKEKSRG